jgi:prepilin-type N-terminal cleavage/methylation domain-containing protein
MNAYRKHSRGFTVVELVMAIAVGLVLLAAVWTAVWSGQRSSTGIERKVTSNQDARAALEIMAMEIRMASFDPGFHSSAIPPTPFWRNPGDCFFGVPTYRGIQEATATSITVEMDLDTDGVCGNSAGEIVRYEYDAANLRINREVITCTAGVRSPLALLSFLGPINGQPEVRTVEVVNGALPVFRYFNGRGVEIPAASLPAAIPTIRRIEIALLVRSQDVDPSTGQRRQMAYSTSVIPRNHGITGI